MTSPIDVPDVLCYRRPSREELTLVNRSFDRWNVFGRTNRYVVLVADINGSSRRAVSLASQELADNIGGVKPYLAGLVVGELSRKKFFPTMAGTDLFCRLSEARGKYYVEINYEAEKLATYGRDVFGTSVVRASTELKENEIVILINSRHEAVAIGITRYAGDMLRRSQMATITTTIDVGQYLRDEDS